MDLTQILAIIVGNAVIVFPVLFLMRTESKLDAQKAFILLNDLKEEMKEIHGVVNSIEEMNKNGK